MVNAEATDTTFAEQLARPTGAPVPLSPVGVAPVAVGAASVPVDCVGMSSPSVDSRSVHCCFATSNSSTSGAIPVYEYQRQRGGRD